MTVFNKFLVAGGSGNWNNTNNWAATSGGTPGDPVPVAGDRVTFDSFSGNANMTVNVASACANLEMQGTYTGTLTFNSTLTTTSTVTFLSGCTIAGTTGTLIGAGNATWTSGGKTLTCAMSCLTSNTTITLADDWIVNGLVSAGFNGNTVTFAGVGRKLTCNGGWHQPAGGAQVLGTAKVVMAGGTWDNAGNGSLSTDVDLQGNVTLSGTVTWGATGKTLKYISGTITTSGSTLSCTTASSFDTSGVTWVNVTFGGAVTYTLTSALAWSGTLALQQTLTISGAALSGTGAVTVITGTTITLNNTGGLVTTGTLTLPNAALTFAGSAGFTVGTLTTASITTSRIHTLTFGNTYTVTTAFSNVGTTATIRQALKSSSAGNKVVFTVNNGSTISLSYCDPTDVDSSAGMLVPSTGGVLTNTLNWSGINRYLVSGGSGTWNNTNNWAPTSGGTAGVSFPTAIENVIIDSGSGNAPMTVNVASACASLVMSGTYTGTLTFDNTLTLTSTCTFLSGCTIAGTAGTLILTGTATYTSAGKTLTCDLTIAGSVNTFTLGDNWTVNGHVTFTSNNTTTVNGNQITCAGGLGMTGASTTALGTTKLVLTGGTWSVTAGNGFRTPIDLAGNVTVSGTVTYNSNTLTYVSGTITTTGSTLSAVLTSGTTTFNTAGVTWNNLTITGSGSIYVLSSNLAWSGTLIIGNTTGTWSGAGTLSGTGAVTVQVGTLTLNNTGGLVTTGTMTLPNGALTFAGSSGFTVGTLTTATLTASRIHTLTFGNTYTVTTAFSNVGTTAAIRQALISSSPGSKVLFNVTPGASLTLAYCDPTDIDSRGGAVVISINGTITTTFNWNTSLISGPGNYGARPLHSGIIDGYCLI